MLIAQLSDFHARPQGVFAYGLDTNALMRAAVAAVGRLDPAPDCVIVTGDLADCGLPEEYAAVVDALSTLDAPTFVLVGNHDRRDVMRAELGPMFPSLTQEPDFLHFAIDDFPVRLIGLDTVSAGEDGGRICAAREAWLARELERGGGRPTFIAMHHPPFLTGVPSMDPMICLTSPSFPRLIAAHPEIERIACGHYHRPIVRRWAGTIGFVGPGTAHQVALDLRKGRPNELIHEPPGYALHAWSEAEGMISHVVPLGDFGAPLPFDPPPEYPGRS